MSYDTSVLSLTKTQTPLYSGNLGRNLLSGEKYFTKYKDQLRAEDIFDTCLSSDAYRRKGRLARGMIN